MADQGSEAENLNEMPVDSIAAQYDHPEWLIDYLKELYGSGETELICEANNETPPVSLRVNLLSGTREETKEMLAAEHGGIELTESAYSPQCIVAKGKFDIGDERLYQEGSFSTD